MLIVELQLNLVTNHPPDQASTSTESVLLHKQSQTEEREQR